jgi:alginate O-acetyltransferase complex protein AlgI
MLFNSWTFLVFLAVTFTAYYLLSWPGWRPVWLQIGLLTIASYVFYAWHTPWLVIVLAASTWINAYVTLRLVRLCTSPDARKNWVTFAILANLGVLIFFKYTSLVVGTFLPHSWWAHWGFDLTQIPLPVGISFFTFQGISLVVDVYRKPEVVLGQPRIGSWEPGVMERGGISNHPSDAIRDKHSPGDSQPSSLFFKVAFFKAFFPQLVAGPIVKAHEFMHQISPKTLSSLDWDDAIRKLILGFFLKMVVADNLGEATAWLHYPEFMGKPGVTLLFMLYAYSFQIFADFAGYSLIAMGLARLFGYELPINFNFPYISRSITEFWRRWHISLSTWLKEYLYIPLGGNRRGELRTYANLIIVMLLGGLWHGAAWSFMIWGGAHGVFLAAERLLGVKLEGHKAQKTHNHEESNLIKGFLATVRIFLIFNLVSMLWLLFQLNEFKDVILYFKELTAWKTTPKSPQIYYAVAVFGFPIIAYHFWGAAKASYWEPFARRHPEIAGRFLKLAYAFLLFLIVTNSGNPGAFIYFQF